jgi:hypothetical protein
MLFEPVWVSSVEHLRTFERIHRETSFLRRLVSGYRLPVGFPYVRLGLGHCVPLVMFANGQLQIQDHQLDFESRPWHVPLVRHHNLRTDWRFSLTAQDIIAVEPFEAISPVNTIHPPADGQDRGPGRFPDVRWQPRPLYGQDPRADWGAIGEASRGFPGCGPRPIGVPLGLTPRSRLLKCRRQPILPSQHGLRAGSGSFPPALYGSYR